MTGSPARVNRGRGRSYPDESLKRANCRASERSALEAAEQEFFAEVALPYRALKSHVELAAVNGLAPLPCGDCRAKEEAWWERRSKHRIRKSLN